jgi:hypothetical protein
MSNGVHVNVAAQKIPAIITQARKKILTASPVLPQTKPQIKPAARKPLYSPALATIGATLIASSRIDLLQKSRLG